MKSATFTDRHGKHHSFRMDEQYGYYTISRHSSYPNDRLTYSDRRRWTPLRSIRTLRTAGEARRFWAFFMSQLNNRRDLRNLGR